VMNKRREVLENLVILRNDVMKDIVIQGIDQALIELDKLEKEKMNGAYKSGYHDALNGRPYKVSDLQRGLR